MGDTNIEWTDKSWNPIRGCSKISTGCNSCYAMHVAARFSGPGQPYEGLAKRDPTNWTGAIRLVPEKLGEPLTWKKPCRVFVNSMSDLFHEDVPDEFIAAVFGIMAATPHTYQVLTKRAERLPEWFAWFERDTEGRFRVPAVIEHAACTVKATGTPGAEKMADRLFKAANDNAGRDRWPLPNVMLGVSVENQQVADERIPPLLRTPAAVRFLSVEPLLGDVNLTPWLYGEGYGSTAGKRGGCGGQMVTSEPSPLSWVIVGGESGRGARSCHVGWIRAVVQQCRGAGVPVFVKQMGGAYVDEPNGVAGAGLKVHPDVADRIAFRLKDPKGGNIDEFPDDLRVREFPEGVAP